MMGEELLHLTDVLCISHAANLDDYGANGTHRANELNG